MDDDWRCASELLRDGRQPADRPADRPGLAGAGHLVADDHRRRVAFSETAGKEPAEALVDARPECVVSAATLGIPVAIEVSRAIGIDHYLILQTTDPAEDPQGSPRRQPEWAAHLHHDAHTVITDYLHHANAMLLRLNLLLLLLLLVVSFLPFPTRLLAEYTSDADPAGTTSHKQSSLRRTDGRTVCQ
jgi:hypothetical protein